MDAYAAKIIEIRTYLDDQLSRTDHTFASDEDAIQRISALSREFVQCVNALPDAMRKDTKFQSAATKVWQRLYEHENLFVLSQTYAATDTHFNIAQLVEKYKNMVIAQQLAELSGAAGAATLSAEVRDDARRDRLVCIYLTKRIQTDKARNLHGFSLVAALGKALDVLLGPLPKSAGRLNIEASAAADLVLMRRLVDAIRHISRVYLLRFSENVVNDTHSPRLGMRRVFFTSYIDLTELRKRVRDSALLESDIDIGIRETRVDQSTLRAYQEFVRMIGLFKIEFQKFAQRVYFLNQPTRLDVSPNARRAERRALCDNLKQLRADVQFVTRETDDGAVFFHEQLQREVYRELSQPIDYAVEQLRCETES